MNYLERLDIHPSVQSFFLPYTSLQNDEIMFKYGTEIEHAGPGFHRVPITESYWSAGNPQTAGQLIISSSAMDAIAWLHVNHYLFPNLRELCFFATGAVPYPTHAEIFTSYKKIHFVYPKDAALCDLKLAASLRRQTITISYKETHYELTFRHQKYLVKHLSLHTLEKLSRYNFRIRSHKPKKHNTYHEQLRNRHPA